MYGIVPVDLDLGGVVKRVKIADLGWFTHPDALFPHFLRVAQW
jgi:hypothetical protein